MEFLIMEVGRHKMTAARFLPKRGTLAFQGADSRSVTDEEGCDLLLRELAAGGAGEDRIILSLDPATFFCRELEFPLGDRQKIRDILPLELKGETALDADDSAFDTVPMEGGKFLVVWGKKKEISSQMELMTGAGLEPRIVTSASFHWRSLLPEDAADHTALSDGTALAVYHDRKPVYFRALGPGEFAPEIGKTLAALEFGKGVKVGRVFLFGEAADRVSDVPPPQDPDIPAFSPLPVTGGLAEAFGADQRSALRLAGAWALAQEVFAGTPVNFRYGELAYTAGFERAKKRLRLSAVLASLFLIILCAESAMRHYLVKKDVDSLNNSIRTIYREIFPTRKKPVDEVGELKSEIKRLGGDMGSRNILAAMRKIAEIKDDRIAGFYEAEFDGNQVRLKGDADTYQAANDFKMRAAALFSAAEVGEIKSRAGGGVSFSFRGTLQEAGR